MQDRITKELISNTVLLRPETESSRRTFPGIFRPRFTRRDPEPIIAYEGITGRPIILESNDGELTEQQHNMILYGGTRGGGKTDLVRQEMERQDTRPSSQGTVASANQTDDEPLGVSRIRELMYRAMGAQTPQTTDNEDGSFTHTFTTNLRSITYGPFQPPVDHIELRFDPSLTEDQRQEQVQAITDSYRNLQPGDEVIHVDQVYPHWWTPEYRHAVHAANRQHSLAHFLEGDLSPAGPDSLITYWDPNRYQLLLTFVQPERVRDIEQSFRGCIHISRSSTDSICIDRVGAERVIDSLRMYFESMGFLPSPTPITRWTYEHWSQARNSWRPELGLADGGLINSPGPDEITLGTISTGQGISIGFDMACGHDYAAFVEYGRGTPVISGVEATRHAEGYFDRVRQSSNTQKPPLTERPKRKINFSKDESEEQ